MTTSSRNGPGTTDRTSDDLADLPSVVRAEMARWNVPGIAVGILKDGDVRLYAFGIGNVETGQPVAPGTLFQIGSITKVFLATLAMRLVEAGLLDLDAPVVTYLPDLRLRDETVRDGVTFRHLLSHTSGILGDYFPDFGPGDDALAKYVEGMAELPQTTPLGGPWTYCNSGFCLAGLAIERLTGQTFEAAMAEWILRPLGLDRSTFWAHEAITHSAAAGHLHEGGAPAVARPYPLARNSNPAGGIISCTRDLLRFAAFHLGDGTADSGERLLKRESLAAMREVQATVNDESEWGLGWALGRVGGVRTLSHGGGTNGFITNLTVVPERNYAIAVLTNSLRGGAAIRPIVRRALADDLGLVSADRPRVTLPPAQLERLAGFYRAPLARVTIVADTETGTLRVETVAENPFTKQERTVSPYRLAPLGEWDFVVTEGENEGARVDFLAGPDGRPTHVRVGGRLAARED